MHANRETEIYLYPLQLLPWPYRNVISVCGICQLLPGIIYDQVERSHRVLDLSFFDPIDEIQQFTLQAAVRFCVGIANVARWIKNPLPKETRNKPAAKIDMIALARDVREYPDAYQAERARRLGVSEKGIGHALRRVDISYKKTLQHPRANEDERRIFQETIQAYQAQHRVIVYIDESGFAHDMPQTHGYAPIGERCHGVCVNWHARGRVNVIGALIDKCLLTVGLFKIWKKDLFMVSSFYLRVVNLPECHQLPG